MEAVRGKGDITKKEMRSEERGHEQKIGEDDRRRRRGRASIENTHRVKMG